MPALARRQVAEPLEAVQGGLHFALETLAASLTARVSSFIAAQVKVHSSDAAMRKSLKAFMPSLLEREFTRGLLEDEQGVRERRAMLVHVLTTADVHALRLDPLEAGSKAKAREDDESLTSEEAAELLHVSRTHLNGLLDTGSIPGMSRTEGGHRRIPKAAVLAYKEVSKQRQARGLEAMAVASQGLGLYKDELAGVPRRAKR